MLPHLLRCQSRKIAGPGIINISAGILNLKKCVFTVNRHVIAVAGGGNRSLFVDQRPVIIADTVDIHPAGAELIHRVGF